MGEINSQETHFVLIHGSSRRSLGMFGWLKLGFRNGEVPEKISPAIFVTAILPDTQHQPSYMLEKFLEKSSSGAEEEQDTAVVSSTPFQLTPIEDLTLLALLNGPGSMFVESLSEANKFTDDRYGSVPRVYIVCTEDILLSPSLQRFMIEQNEVKEVMEIPADHMALFF
ncbi:METHYLESTERASE FAMILY MEMBER [Salix purpurea]|uniref:METHYLESTERASE FAMILY MEMBER n=1 Tax=Salix purpurea TaxID=77065 RepID=A0A9Q1AKB3_SALPP|nr:METHYLESTERASE FAMILY MEMBER [Salix purpurea]